MDRHDQTILRLLQQKGRISFSALSIRVGLSVPAVTERVRKLEATGVILRYTAVLDGQKIGNKLTAFINVAINDPKTYSTFAESILQLEAVMECHHVVGEFDYLIKVKTRDTASLEDLISRHIRPIQGVGRTRTTVVLSSLREGTMIEPDFES